MTSEKTVRHLLMDGPGEALCDACLALACAVSLTEMRQITRRVLGDPSFQRGGSCASCRRVVPTIVYPSSCPQCGRLIMPGQEPCCSYAVVAPDGAAGDA
jgi:hypothetical protein